MDPVCQPQPFTFTRMLQSEFPADLIDAAKLDLREHVSERLIKEALTTLMGENGDRSSVYHKAIQLTRMAKILLELKSADSIGLYALVKSWIESKPEQEIRAIAIKSNVYANTDSLSQSQSTATTVAVFSLHLIAEDLLSLKR